MAYEFKLPDLGEGVVEGEIVKWLVAAGDEVTEDQPLLEIMTDKATVAIPSPRAGTVVETKGGEGDVVEVGQVLVVIDTGDGAPAEKPAPEAEAEKPAAEAKAEKPAPEAKAEEPAAEAKAEKPAPEAKPEKREAPEPEQRAEAGAGRQARGKQPAGEEKAGRPPEAGAPEGEPRTDSSNGHGPAQPDTPPARLVEGLPARSTTPVAGRIPPARSRAPTERRVSASPSVRRRARELGVDLEALEGTGDAGRVTAGDVEEAARGPAPAAAPPAEKAPKGPPYNLPPGVEPPPPGGERRVAVRGLRKRIVEKMHKSTTTAAHFTFVEEVDMSRLWRMREELKPVAEAQGVRLTFMPFFVKAAALALARHPQLNTMLDDEAGELVYRGFYNLGMAVATERGLMVVVVRDADQKSLLDIAREVERLAEEARSGTVRLEDLTGSTFTITSLGAQGGLFATPVINWPEVAIMGIHQIKDRPVIEDGQVVPGKIMLLSLSFDHRVVDGHIGAAFAYEVIALLEHPERLFLELR